MKRRYNFFQRIVQVRKVGLLLMAVLLTVFAFSANAQTYCTPSPAPTNSSYYINDFSTTGGMVNISNLNSGMSAGGYGDFTSQMVKVQPGGTFNFSSTFASFNTFGAVIWIDWNHNGSFTDPGEKVYSTTTYVNSISGSITVPTTAVPGNTRLRIRIHYLNQTGPTSPCTETYNSYYIGETEDYTVSIGGPNNAGVDSLVSPVNDNNLCSGRQVVKVRVSNNGTNPLDSVNVNWSLNGVLQPAHSFVFSPAIDSVLATNHYVTVTLGVIDLPLQSPVTIKAWTSMPNGVNDTYHADDTLTETVTSQIHGITSHITTVGDTPLCGNQTVILNAGSQPLGSLFIWNNGYTTQMSVANQVGTYDVIVQSPQGCFAYDTIKINGGHTPTITSLGIVDQGGGQFIFTPASPQYVDSFRWNFGDGTIYTVGTGAPQTHQYMQDGTYSASVTLINNCGEEVHGNQVFVDRTTGIQQMNGLTASLNVYPNPARDMVTIAMKDAKMTRVTVYDVLGRKIADEKTTDPYKYELNLSNESSGVYTIGVYTDKGRIFRKLNVVK